MLTKTDILDVLEKHKPYFASELGVKRIGLFGSYARGNQKPGSDVDVLIEMPANFDHLCAVWKKLEKELDAKIDLLRVGSHLRKSFLRDLKKEIIYV